MLTAGGLPALRSMFKGPEPQRIYRPQEPIRLAASGAWHATAYGTLDATKPGWSGLTPKLFRLGQSGQYP